MKSLVSELPDRDRAAPSVSSWIDFARAARFPADRRRAFGGVLFKPDVHDKAMLIRRLAIERPPRVNPQ